MLPNFQMPKHSFCINSIFKYKTITSVFYDSQNTFNNAPVSNAISSQKITYTPSLLKEDHFLLCSQVGMKMDRLEYFGGFPIPSTH